MATVRYPDPVGDLTAALAKQTSPSGASTVGVQDADGLIGGAQTSELAIKQLAINANRALALGCAPPAAAGLQLLYTALDVDGQGDLSLTDGAAQQNLRNRGVQLATGDASQATAGKRPIWRKIATAGKLGDLSALDSPDGARLISSTGSITSIAQRCIVALLINPTNSSDDGVHSWFSANADNFAIYSRHTNQIALFAGSEVLSGAVLLTQGKWNSVVCDVNGASSIISINGTQTSALNPGANACSGTVNMFAQAGTAVPATGMMALAAVWGTTLPGSIVEVERWLQKIYNQTAFGV